MQTVINDMVFIEKQNSMKAKRKTAMYN